MGVVYRRPLFQLNRNFYMFLAIALTIVNVIVFIGLSDGWFRRIYNNHRAEELRLELIPRFRDFRLGRWDSSRKYHMFDNLVVGENYTNLSKESRVTLVTQTDPDHFHHIYELTMRWKGPISAALFAAGEEEKVVLETQLRFLRRCYEDIASRIVFHLAVQNRRVFRTWNIATLEESLGDFQTGLECELYEEAFTRIVDLWRPYNVKYIMRNKRQIYPQNHLRNLARKNSQTSFVFLTDVDIIPCSNLWEDLEKFLSKIPDTISQTKKKILKRRGSGEPKVVYVIPTYELDDWKPFPESKNEMVQLAKRRLARPFHQKISDNQRYTNFRRWQRKNDSEDEVRVAYNVTKFELDYEPFYVVRDTAPPHDERFVGYEFTQNTQVYEMLIAGYTFSVLSPVFTVHWGFKMRKIYPKWRERQIYKNRKKGKAFRAELAALYGVQPSKRTYKPKTQP